MALVKVARVDEIAAGTGKVASAGGKAIAVFNIDGVFRATDNACTHRGGPLGEGRVNGTVVTCPWHGSEFDVATGQVVKGPATRPVSTYPTQVQGNDVLVDVG
jgi:nitrite reductase/ring-hydroxylating ferredoxin subunit